MAIDLTAALFVALVVLLIVGLRKIGTSRTRSRGRLQDVGDAPPSAEPIATPRLDDIGLGTYSLDVAADADQAPPDERPDNV